jgi:hypothetical protein
MVMQLAAQRLYLTRSLRRGTSLWGYTQRSKPVSSRNCRLLDLSVTKRRPVVVEQTCATGDGCCFSFPAGGRRSAGFTCSRAPKRRWYQQRVGAVSLRGRGSRVLEQGSMELRGKSLKLVRGRSCSALSAATWRERSWVSCRRAVLLGGWTNASERPLGCDLGDAVRTAGCGFQAALVLTGENGLYARG